MKTGIDISKWQGDIDFAKVKASGIEFVIARSSYRQKVDPKFHEYVKGCRDNNIPILGIYHFMYALNDQQSLEEAKFCVSQAKKAGLDPASTYIFSDFEGDTVTKAAQSGVTLGKEECNRFTQIFCDYVLSQGYKTGIYTNNNYYKNWYTAEMLNKYPIWLADYSGGPDHSCLLQQYTSSGSVDGINGKVDMNHLYEDEKNAETPKKEEVVTMGKSRQAVVDLARSWEGKKESDGSFKSIIDIYNSYKGQFPRGTKMQYNWAWCACTWSALAIKLGYTSIMPIEISCGFLINAAKKMGCWQENDGYVAQPGDAILYDWDDSGKGDNTAWPDHVGVVIETYKDAGYFVVMEGNYNNAVKRRTISINGKYIRGFITPKYEVNVVTAPSQESGKTVETIAREVIAGKWGSGTARKTALENAGYDYAKVQNAVNKILNGSAATTTKPEQNNAQVITKKVETSCHAKKFDKSIAGTYKTTADLYCRNDAGTNKKALCLIPKNTEVKNYGYYSTANGVKWYLIQFVMDGVQYTGFSSSKYLARK